MEGGWGRKKNGHADRYTQQTQPDMMQRGGGGGGGGGREARRQTDKYTQQRESDTMHAGMQADRGRQEYR